MQRVALLLGISGHQTDVNDMICSRLCRVLYKILHLLLCEDGSPASHRNLSRMWKALRSLASRNGRRSLCAIISRPRYCGVPMS